jgi:hypothetical protein
MRAGTAWTLACVSFVLVVADVLVTAAYRPLLSEAAVAEHGFPFIDGAVLGSAVLGAVILARYERQIVGTLLSLIGVTGAFSLVAEAYSIWVISEDGPGPRGFAGLAGWLSAIFGGQLALGGLALMFLLAPDGRFLSSRWKYAAACIGVGELCCALAVGSGNPTDFDIEATDVGPVRGPLFTFGFSLIAVGLLAAVVSMLVRLRRSTGEERQQVRLIALGAALVLVGVAVLGLVQERTAANRPGQRRCRCSPRICCCRSSWRSPSCAIGCTTSTSSSTGPSCWRSDGIRRGRLHHPRGGGGLAGGRSH